MATRKTTAKKTTTKKTATKKTAAKKITPEVKETSEAEEAAEGVEKTESPAPKAVEEASISPTIEIGSDIPLPAEVSDTPEAVETIEAVPEGLVSIQAEEIEPEEVVGVVSKPVEEHAEQVDEAYVAIRSLITLSATPRVGRFSFCDISGRVLSTGKPVRGKVVDGAVYQVPPHVADFMVEKNWAIKV